MVKNERVAGALREALTSFAQVDQSSAARVVVTVFGVMQSKRPAPRLDELSYSTFGVAAPAAIGTAYVHY